MNERLNDNVEHSHVRTNEDEFTFPHFHFMDVIHNKLIWVNHIFREKPYVYEVCSFIVGIIFFLLPLTHFGINAYNEFSYQKFIHGKIKLSGTLSLMILFNYLIIGFLIAVLILKFLDVNLTPNFMNWNMRTIGSLIQYILLAFCIRSLLHSLKGIFLQFEIMNSFPTFNKGISLDSLIHPIEVYIYCYLFRLALFYNNHSLSHMLICLSFVIMILYSNLTTNEASFSCFQNYLKIIIFILSCYLFYILECIQKKVTETRKSNRTMLIVLNGIIAIGIILSIVACLKIIKYDLMKFINNIKGIGYIAGVGAGLIFVGNSYYAGSLMINFIFYPIEKQYFVYRNQKYAKYIKVAKCVQYGESKYNVRQ